jgi:hypothetical protein
MWHKCKVEPFMPKQCNKFMCAWVQEGFLSDLQPIVGVSLNKQAKQQRDVWLTTPGWLIWLTCILSDRFNCIPVRGVPLNHESKTEDFLLFVFRSVSPGKTVNMLVCPWPSPKAIT